MKYVFVLELVSLEGKLVNLYSAILLTAFINDNTVNMCKNLIVKGVDGKCR